MRIPPDFPDSRHFVRTGLLLDTQQVRANIAAMAAKAAASAVRFRPHFKTHQSRRIGAWFREEGVQAITVSSLEMAAYFAEDNEQGGWRDITVAFPVNLREARLLNRLAGEIELSLLVDAEPVVSQLANLLQHEISLWIEIDTGYQRSGVDWRQTDRLARIIAAVEASPRLRFAGLLSHAGRTYQAPDPDAVVAQFRETNVQLQECRELLGRPDCPLSVGDTPGCSLAPDFAGVDEVRPGNFIFYDLMQERLSACREEEIALVVATPVVAVYPERRHIVIQGGAVHISLETLPGPDDGPIYGYAGTMDVDGGLRINRQAPLVSLSQEHGIIEDLRGELLAAVRPGDLLTVFPVHACLTADLYPLYHTVAGDRIERRRSNDINPGGYNEP